MLLYRHYKNQNYRYLGTVRHSETLEEMALYDCLYPNDLGKTWVRPLEMFHGSIEIDGTPVTRFAPVPLVIKKITEISLDDVAIVNSLSVEIFGDARNPNFDEILKNTKAPLLLLAEVDGDIVGFKLGCRLSDEIFCSFIGGVKTSYHKLGIASALMHEQHEWCRQQRYKKIQIKIQNKFSGMLILNLKSGFEIVSTEHSTRDEDLQVVMEKEIV